MAERAYPLVIAKTTSTASALSNSMSRHPSLASFLCRPAQEDAAQQVAEPAETAEQKDGARHAPGLHPQLEEIDIPDGRVDRGVDHREDNERQHRQDNRSSQRRDTTPMMIGKIRIATEATLG